MTIRRIVCPFCGKEGIRPTFHLPTPEGEGCPYTPMTCPANTPAPSGDEGTERQDRVDAHTASSDSSVANGERPPTDGGPSRHYD